MGEIRLDSKGQPERRRNRVFVTRNTEYHCHDGVCVAVRDRETGRWIPHHPALNFPVSSGFSVDQHSMPHLRQPDLGRPLIFYTAGPRSLVTTPIQSIGRPAREELSQYPAHQ
jgi:hypothetical protein